MATTNSPEQSSSRSSFPASGGIQFLSCDWGTSSFRLQLADGRSGQSLAAVSNPNGINAVHQAWQAAGGVALERDGYFLNVLRAQIEKLAQETGQSLAGLPVVVSGMITASIGLREIPHAPMPFALDGSDLRIERLTPPPEGLGPVLLVSGARTADDVMRGEEIQVVGAAALGGPREALYLLPGTHSKHVTVARGRAIGLRTYMTGEFFSLLAKKSILANSVEETGGAADESAFVDGVLAGAKENLLHAAFGVRVAELSARRARAAGWHYLSGMMIGAELRELAAEADAAVVLVGSPTLVARYAAALRALGHRGPVTTVSGEAAVIAGQRMALVRHAGFDPHEFPP